MCNFSGRLIAWLDGELPEAEAVNVEWHLRQCEECRCASASYREISGAFLDCYMAAMPVRSRSNRGRWFALAGSVAATILIAAVLFPRPRPHALPSPPLALSAPSFAFEKAPPRIIAFQARPVHVFHTRPTPVFDARPAPALRARTTPTFKPVREQWVTVEPTVEISLPADALFPPGAVPPGFSYIADIRPQP